jgi:hypothetical protein
MNLGLQRFSYIEPENFQTSTCVITRITGRRYGRTSEYTCTTSETEGRSFMTVICSCVLKWIKLFCVIRLEVYIAYKVS